MMSYVNIPPGSFTLTTRSKKLTFTEKPVQNSVKGQMKDVQFHTGWSQEWTSAKRLKKTNCLYIHEVVRGPFCQPKLLKSRPFVTISSCQAEITEKKCGNKRSGIPDTWREYLDSRGLCNTVQTSVLKKNLLPCCIKCHTTGKLWNELGLPFLQGIPDPWKNKPYSPKWYIERSSRLYKRNTYKRCKFNYDGDDEAETEQDARRHNQLNETYIGTNDDKYRADNKRIINKPDIVEKGEKIVDHLPKVKENVKFSIDRKSMKDASSKLKETGRVVQGKYRRVIGSANIEKSSKELGDNKQKKEKQPMAKPSTTSKIINHKSVQIGSTKREERALQTDNVSRNSTRRVRPTIGTVCCNCTLQRYQINDTDLSKRVLCTECENFYRGSRSRTGEFATRANDFCPPNARRIPKRKANVARGRLCKWPKTKLCDCLSNAKHRSRETEGRNRVVTNSTVISNRELRFVCRECDCPYLKIASTHRDKLSGKQKNVHDESRNAGSDEPNGRVQRNSKNSTARRQRRLMRCDSENRSCACTENKTHTSEQSPQLTAIKSRKNPYTVNKSSKNSLNDDTNDARGKGNRVSTSEVESDRNELETISVSKYYNESSSDGEENGLWYKKKGDCCSRRKIRKKKRERIGEGLTSSDEDQKCHFKRNTSLSCARTDSGAIGDASDASAKVSSNTGGEGGLSVTSMTLINRLQEAIPLRRFKES